jgi:predicted glutamine amidotransferase
MCRLFGLSAAPARVRATFWLLDAADSLAVQSRREPDGVGLGVFSEDGTPVVDKQPVAAYLDPDFGREARELTSTTFLGHIRFASTGGLETVNTHPFAQDGRLFAHNGVVEGLDLLDGELSRQPGDARSWVKGQTDSERVFALITAYARRTGDLSAAITEAAGWVAANLPLFALNIVLTTPTELYALRYPETHRLFVLERAAGGPRGDRHLEHASPAGTMRVRSGDLARTPAVVVASERMDEDPGWRELASGELLTVTPGPHVTSKIILPDPPTHPLTLAGLHPQAAASQSTPTPG